MSRKLLSSFLGVLLPPVLSLGVASTPMDDGQSGDSSTSYPKTNVTVGPNGEFTVEGVQKSGVAVAGTNPWVGGGYGPVWGGGEPGVGEEARTPLCSEGFGGACAFVERDDPTEVPPPADGDSEGGVTGLSGEQVQQELARLQAGGAGLVVQPDARSYVGVPTLAHASRPEQSLETVILGDTIRLDLYAVGFSFDFGDGSAPLESAVPGGPYPDMTNQHTYRQPAPEVAVTLVTVWSVSAFNVSSGQVIPVSGGVSTREVSKPFDVRKSRTVLTDGGEEPHR